MIEWKVTAFDATDVNSLYKILQLRTEIFVVEQDAIYQDMDDKDQVATHLHGYIGGELIAYCRLFRPGDYFDEASIGRVVVNSKYRRKGYGHILMDKAIELITLSMNENVITISAQLYLKEFYETHGFVKVSEVYQEDGIPHIRMKRGIVELL
ncbi:GNAT family N-acetyltransferase [Dysgonomonas sp. 216]|uniref:GNAT family N-acetyltransferase n=1 Tax=Dysgonomonas sp. 216 TaxID=2302934 RepID=UPI0013D7A92A|nr:GNAT family N-acetyltransferase [Dysgonomonas sp. 216]NDW17872.1 GNAT family N-acetyltransferase [Dysgonomonas sp. 216]